MEDGKCSECGSALPRGAVRCATCGAPVSSDVKKCPECGKMIPAKAVFCPRCGKMVWNDMAEEPQPAPEPQPAETEAGRVSIDEEAEPAGDEPQPGNGRQGDTKLKYTITAVLVAVVVCLAVCNICDWGDGGSEADNTHLSLADSDAETQPESEQMSIVEASDIYGDAMVRNNRAGDGSAFGPAAYTLHGGRPLIVGVNYSYSDKQRPFIKLTQLSKIDGRWRCGEETVRHEDGGVIVMDRDRLRLAGEDIPRFEIIDGKHYFYFVYLVSPVGRMPGTAAWCHLKLTLFNVESADVVQLDYACEPVTAEHGDTLYYGHVENRRETPEFKFLEDELGRLPIVYKPTPEEQEMAEPANASRKWLADNGEMLSQLEKGRQEVAFTPTRYDSPLFSRSDVVMDSRVSTEAYVYYATHTGTVFGYDRNAKEFFIVYASSHGSVPQIEINGNGTLHVSAEEVNFDFDPATGCATLNRE